MKVVILAAGYGTRLYALIKDTPKPLLEINGKPLINFIMDRVAKINKLNEIIVVTNNKFYDNFQDWAKKQKKSLYKITVINDGTNCPEERLGSIGDLEFALKRCEVDEDVLLVGGDNLFDYNIDEYIKESATRTQQVTIGLYDVGSIQDAKKFGVVELDANKKVISFEEKPESPKSTLVGMCFYFFPKKTLDLVAKYLSETEKSDTAGDYIRWLNEKNKVYGFKFSGKWYDIGSIESYFEAQKNFL